MITVTYRFKNDRPSIHASKYVCDTTEQYNTFMRTYGRKIIVENVHATSPRYDSPVAMPMAWWWEPNAEEPKEGALTEDVR